jgi:hypothetical protein
MPRERTTMRKIREIRRLKWREYSRAVRLVRKLKHDGDTMSDKNFAADDLRYGAALIVAITGILVAGGLAYLLSTNAAWKPSEVAALIGLFTGICGTLVGAFLGVQVGAAGKQKAQALAERALAALSPEAAKKAMDG